MAARLRSGRVELRQIDVRRKLDREVCNWGRRNDSQWDACVEERWARTYSGWMPRDGAYTLSLWNKNRTFIPCEAVPPYIKCRSH